LAGEIKGMFGGPTSIKNGKRPAINGWDSPIHKAPAIFAYSET
jgi:hypothetical protein